MAAKRKTRAREAQLAFEALSIEGGLLSPEWLSKVAQLQAGTQADADYRIHKGLNLRDEIGRYWRIAQAHWTDFKLGSAANPGAIAVSERFVAGLLREGFGFSSLAAVEPVVLQEREYPIGHASLGGRVPVIIAPPESGLDTPSAAFGDGTRKRSAFGLAQEYLNAQEAALWGIATDGTTLRIVRDNASLTRPAWVEVDLQRIFTEERYADFTALWLLCHETRFGREGQPVTECALEAWRDAGREEGTRARAHLRRGVEDALVALGQGFLSHVENQPLRAALQGGTLPVKDYFNQLLRLVYRLIFLLTAEERGLLHPDGTSDSAKALYTNGYGLRRLRERSVKRSAHDRFSDLWEATKVVCRGLATGEPRLGLPALAGIFATSQCTALDTAKLENRALLLAVFKLAWLREDGSLSRVNWRDMGPEELGSVYESLLELVPQVAQGGRQFAFAAGGETKGNARKTSGSYYTPDSLVQVLLDSALEPVIAETVARNPASPIEGLLGLSIVDPACGSGHFLLAAARRLAAHVARLQANGTPSAAEYRRALRQVVGRCIFGVDLNPMAVELCKVGLWMEAVEPGLPLTFLDSHIQCGNALLGTTPELMANGIPDAAWEAIEGDDNRSASALKKRNKKSAGGQRGLDTLWSNPVDAEAQVVARALADLDAASDSDLEALGMKEGRWHGILDSPEFLHQKFVADAWCAAFVWPKQAGELADAAPTNEVWRQLRDGQGQAPALTTKIVGELADQYRFFHWHLQFPQVFATGGFDLVLGNPPWEKAKLSDKEFFSEARPDIARSQATVRREAIARLAAEDPGLFTAYRAALRSAQGATAICCGGRFPLCAIGDINLYGLFAEGMLQLVSRRGRAGMVVPSGIITDETYSAFFRDLIGRARLATAWDFENRDGSGRKWFSAVDSRQKFTLLTLSGTRLDSSARFAFFLRSPSDLSGARILELDAQDFAAINPKTHTCPVFRSVEDARIARAAYRRGRVLRLSDAQPDPWYMRLARVFDMTNDDGLMQTNAGDQPGLLPVFEGKMIDAYNHRSASIEFRPENASRQLQPVGASVEEWSDPSWRATAYHFVPESEFSLRAAALPFGWPHRWFLCSKRVTASTNERTMIAAIVPWAGLSYTLYVTTLEDPDPRRVAALLANYNSFAFDYFVRQKTSQPSLPMGCVYESPAIDPLLLKKAVPWDRGSALDEWIASRVVELTCTSFDLVEFGHALGYGEAPFRWNESRRHDLRCELDAAFFHLYGIPRDDVAFVMETFPTVRKNDQKTHGEYRTKHVVLEIFDEMAEAVRSDAPYQTRLVPPPADSSVAYRARRPVFPSMPSVVPQIQPREETAIVIWALLYAAGGTITRTELARAFALRARPKLLTDLAPASLDQAKGWAAKVKGRTVAEGLLTSTLTELSERAGVALGADDHSRATVTTTTGTPPEDRLDPWFLFEARLALQVLRAQPATAFGAIDESLGGDDHELLGKAGTPW